MLLDLLSDLTRSTGTIAAAQSAQLASLVGSERFIGAIAVAQAAQSSSETAGEDYRANIVTLQAAQVASIAASERFIAAVAAAQAVQFAALVGVERFIATVAASQSVQSDTIAASTTANSTAVIATVQAQQATDIEAMGPVVVDPPATSAQGWVHAARVIGRASARKPKVAAAIAASQKRQSSAIEADTEDLAYLYLELAA